MAMMAEPLRGLSEFLAILRALERGDRSPYPFYCTLLYTITEGADAAVARYVDEHWDDLDAMTGDHCLVFVIGDVHDEPAAGYRPFRSAEVYRVADHLGVSPSSLPSAAFFAEPDSSRELVRLRLADYVSAAADDPIDVPAFTRGFRAIASATNRCAGRDSEADRLDCLRERLIAERPRIVGDSAPTATGRLEKTASTLATVEKVLSSGTTIAATILGALALG